MLDSNCGTNNSSISAHKIQELAEKLLQLNADKATIVEWMELSVYALFAQEEKWEEELLDLLAVLTGVKT